MDEEGRVKVLQNDLLFLQREHKVVLHGLHEEIERLQQKCSDLQFSLTTSLGSAKAEESLRQQLQNIQDISDDQSRQIKEFRQIMVQKDARIEELEDQMKWKELDFQNQLCSKDAKIEQLQKKIVAQAEVNKLQDQCKKIYEHSVKQSQDKMEDVIRRAKVPEVANSVQRKSSSAQSFLSSDDDSAEVVVMPISRPLPDPVSRRSRIFRHQLSNSLSRNHTNNNDELWERRFDKKMSLPTNYKASVATLPPIMARSNSLVASDQNVRSFKDSQLKSSPEIAEIEVPVLADVSSGVKVSKDKRQHHHHHQDKNEHYAMIAAGQQKDSFA